MTRGGPDGRRRLLSGPIRVIQSPQSCPFACPSELLSPWSNPGGASVVKCPRRFPRLWLLQRKRASGPPMAADGRHPGLSASLKAHRAACPRAMANCAAFGRTQGPPARPRANGGPPPLLRHTQKHPTWAPGGRYWSPPGSIRAIQSSQGCAFMCPSEPRGLWSGPGATGKVLGRSSCPVALKSHTHATAVCAGSGPSRIRQSPPSYLLLFRSRGRRKSPSPTAASKPSAFGPQAAHVLHTLDHRHSRWNGRRLSQPWPLSQ